MWTNKAPKKIGYYWFRSPAERVWNGIPYEISQNGFGEPWVVRIEYVQKSWAHRSQGEHLSCFQGSPDGPALASIPGGQWCGPLEPPA